MEERLQKILSRHGYGSRREAEKYIIDGKVTVNGKACHSWAESR
jgi:23S rRNA pseudouridine2605 synthase